jgi:hypothetical protein
MNIASLHFANKLEISLNFNGEFTGPMPAHAILLIKRSQGNLSRCVDVGEGRVISIRALFCIR